MSAFERSEAWRVGDEGQRWVGRKLVETGHSIVPLWSVFEKRYGRSPRPTYLYTPEGQHELPDFDVSALGQGNFYVEVKTKNAPGWRRDRVQLEHAWNAKLHRAYEAVQRCRRAPVVVVVYEETTGLLLRASLDELRPHQLADVLIRGTWCTPFPRGAFSPFGSVGFRRPPKNADAVAALTHLTTAARDALLALPLLPSITAIAMAQGACRA